MSYGSHRCAVMGTGNKDRNLEQLWKKERLGHVEAG